MIFRERKIKRSNQKSKKIIALIQEVNHRIQSKRLHRIDRFLRFVFYTLGWTGAKFRNEIAAFLSDSRNLSCVIIVLMILIIILIDFLVSYIDRWIQYGDTWKEGTEANTGDNM